MVVAAIGAAAAWRDFRAPVPPARDGVITFAADARGVSWSAPVLVGPDDRTDRPNIVLYVLDALRADRLGVYGSPASVAPAIDGLGRAGLVFRRAYAAASWTKPSVVSLLTSLSPQTHGVGALYYTDCQRREPSRFIRAHRLPVEADRA